jgi:hypothetical protein
LTEVGTHSACARSTTGGQGVTVNIKHRTYTHIIISNQRGHAVSMGPVHFWWEKKKRKRKYVINYTETKMDMKLKVPQLFIY